MNIVRVTKSENLPCEQLVKYVDQRVQLTESNLSNLCACLGVYLKKMSKLRDARDCLAQELHDLFNRETINASLSSKTGELAHILASVGDRSEFQIQEIDTECIKRLSQYDAHCKGVKHEVKNILNAKEREISRRQYLQKVQEKFPHERQKLSRAEADVVKAVSESSQALQAMEEYLEIFERNKLQDIKCSLQHLILSEMKFYAKALELYTKAYEVVSDIDESGDVKNFRKQLHKFKTDDRHKILLSSKDQPVKAKDGGPLNASSNDTQNP